MGVELLECCICCSAMIGGIYQCEDGHLVCETCKPNMRNMCGTCRQPLGQIRNRALEKLAGCLNLPCKFSHSGCKQCVSGKDREAHEANCEYAPRITRADAFWARNIMENALNEVHDSRIRPEILARAREQRRMAQERRMS